MGSRIFDLTVTGCFDSREDPYSFCSRAAHLQLGPLSIFKDKEKLSPRYVPHRLPHREEALSILQFLFSGAVTAAESWNLRTVQLVGPAGAGMTSFLLVFGRRLEQEAKELRVDLRHLYVNLKLHGGRRVVLYRHLLAQVAPERLSLSLSAEEILRRMTSHLREKKRFLLISLDEVDLAENHEGDLRHL